MGYIDYAYYTETYKGSTIPESAFSKFATKAENKVNLMTFDRIDTSKDYMDKVKMCCCEIAESLYTADKEDSKSAGNVLSERVGDYSVSFVDNSNLEKLRSAKLKSIVQDWLALTGLLYRGLC